MLNASQRDASARLAELSQSSTPASTRAGCHEANDWPAMRAEADDDVGRPYSWHLEEVGFVDQGADDVAHVEASLRRPGMTLDAALELAPWLAVLCLASLCRGGSKAGV